MMRGCVCTYKWWTGTHTLTVCIDKRIVLFFTAYSGQKCSAQSALFVHSNWVKAGILPKLEELAGRRKLSDLTIGPILTVNNSRYCS